MKWIIRCSLSYYILDRSVEDSWLSMEPEITFVSGHNFYSACSPPHSPLSPSLHSSAVVRPINHRASAYHLGAPIACQSSDKMDFQLSQGSQAGPGRMENRQTSAALLPLLTFFCLLFGFLLVSRTVFWACPSSSLSTPLTPSLWSPWPKPHEMKIGSL